MKNEFIPYQQSLELKELGFDEECLFEFYGKSDLSNFKESDYELCGDRHNSSFKEDGRVSAPLYQQVFRWFRENYDLHYNIDYVSAADIFKYELWIKGRIYKYNTYEEAELACLNKLIELVKL
jgi:hypothetical protein